MKRASAKKNIDFRFQLRIAPGHVPMTLWTDCTNVMPFEHQDVRIHTKIAKIDVWKQILHLNEA